MQKMLKQIFGDYHSREVKKLKPILERVNAWEEEVRSWPDEKFKAKTAEFKERVEQGESLEELLPEAFATAREAARRTLGERHYDVQVLGGVILHQGSIAEMRTGEGKTLVGTLPVYLNALTGRGVHVVTVNDYLSRRDAVWMGQVYDLLGLSVGVITQNSSYLYDPEHEHLDEERDELGSFKVVEDFLRPVDRPESYAADITYGANNEFGFDYLRDNTEYEVSRLRQRDFNFALIDEVDSVLIDEARTPLIISAPGKDSDDLYQTFARIAKQLTPEEDYEVDEKMKAVSMTDQGISRAEKLLGVDNIYTERGIKYVHHLETAVRAKALYEKDTDYVVREEQVVIVDPFTGRLQPGRRWSEGLHQAIEAKEGLKVQRESRTFASVTYQNFFRLYPKVAGMTGTAVSSAEEFMKVYGLNTLAVPTHRPIQRTDLNDQIYQTEQGKFKAIADKVKELNQKKQPILIGTVSIEKNELLSEYLKQVGVKHEVLNAKNHEREGEVIAQAGRLGGVTIATNMAGRGVDIKLGGNPATKEQYEKVKELGGLFVLGTERHEARRIDNQLRGRAGRQGDPGATQFFVSLEDSLMRVFASDTIKKVMGTFKVPEDQPIESRFISRSLEKAQEKIEGFHFDARKQILKFDDVLNTQRIAIYKERRTLLLGSQEEVLQYLDGLLQVATKEEVEAVEVKKKELGEGRFIDLARRVILQTIDMFWMEHLEVMDYTRSSVNLRAYGQRDPLVEYRKEGLRLFNEMKETIAEEAVKLLPHIGAGLAQVEEVERKEVNNKSSSGGGAARSKPVVKNESEVGRNDPCPCGSGKKYKKCCGK